MIGRGPVLNASFEPLSVVASRRALVLVLADKAVLVHGTGHDLHSARARFPEPSIVRLVNYVRVPHQARVAVTRRSVFARDGHRCQYCGAQAENIDHVVPREPGWDAQLGQRRGLLSPLQHPQGGQPARRGRLPTGEDSGGTPLPPLVAGRERRGSRRMGSVRGSCPRACCRPLSSRRFPPPCTAVGVCSSVRLRPRSCTASGRIRSVTGSPACACLPTGPS